MRTYKHKVRTILDGEWAYDFDKLEAIFNEEGAAGWLLTNMQSIPGFSGAFLCVFTRFD